MPSTVSARFLLSVACLDLAKYELARYVIRENARRMEKPSTSNTSAIFAWTPHKLIGLIALLMTAGIVLWLTAHVLLLIFIGILVAILLSFLSGYLRDHTPLSYSWSLAAVLLLLFIVACAFLGLAGTRIAAETDDLASNLQDSWAQLKQRAGQYEWAKQLISQSEKGFLANIPDGWLGQITGVLGATLGAMSSGLLVIFVAIFVAVDPSLYRRGLVLLVPIHYRDRAQEVLDEVGVKLRWWFIGQIFSMVVAGTSIAIGLWLLGIPFFFSLGILASVHRRHFG